MKVSGVQQTSDPYEFQCMGAKTLIKNTNKESFISDSFNMQLVTISGQNAFFNGHPVWVEYDKNVEKHIRGSRYDL